MRHLYSALLYALLPLVLARMLWRSLRAPAYRRRLAERFGLFRPWPDLERPAIWVHAVSVGEVLAAQPLIDHLLDTRPQVRVIVTTMTPTGSDRVRELFGARVQHVYCPWDLPGSVRRFLARTRPQLLVLMETELWPNLLALSRQSGCRALLVNARLSQRSVERYRRFPAVTRAMLAELAFIACQSQRDSERFLSLGADKERVLVSGNLKFDQTLSEPSRALAGQLSQALATQLRPVLVAGSTHPGEDESVLEAFRQVRVRYPNCLLILAPRHPERFAAVYELCCRAGFATGRRAQGAMPDGAMAVLLADTLGELAGLYGVASVAFVGGSLVPFGGHNPIEPARWGVPLICGPHLDNFTDVSDQFRSVGAMQIVAGTTELAAAVLALLDSEERRVALGRSGREVVRQGAGALQQISMLVAQVLQEITSSR